MTHQKLRPVTARNGAGLVVVDQHPADDAHNFSDASTDQQAQAAHRENRRRRLAEQVHRLGPAPVLHLLLEVAAGADLDARLAIYASLPGEFIRDLGGDRFAAPLLALDGGRA